MALSVQDDLRSGQTVSCATVLNLKVWFRALMAGLVGCLLALTAAGAESELPTYVDGSYVVVVEFPGVGPTETTVECSGEPGDSTCAAIEDALTYGVNYREGSANLCEVDRESTGRAQITGVLDGSEIDITLDRANTCDRWAWDLQFSEILPPPPGITFPLLAPDRGALVVGTLWRDGTQIDSGLPLLAIISSPRNDIRLDFCGLGSVGSIRVDENKRWDRPYNPRTARPVECGNGPTTNEAETALSLMFESLVFTVDGGFDFVLAANGVELRFEPVPALEDDRPPEILDFAFETETGMLTWNATDPEGGTLWACVTVANRAGSKFERTCDTSSGVRTVDITDPEIASIDLTVYDRLNEWDNRYIVVRQELIDEYEAEKQALKLESVAEERRRSRWRAASFAGLGVALVSAWAALAFSRRRWTTRKS